MHTFARIKLCAMGEASTVMQWTRNRSFTNRDAVLNLWYSVGLVIELLIASKLLPMGAPAVWLAYLLIGSSALCVAAGFVWYLLWALERGFALSYLAAICLTFVPAAAASIHRLCPRRVASDLRGRSRPCRRGILHLPDFEGPVEQMLQDAVARRGRCRRRVARRMEKQRVISRHGVSMMCSVSGLYV